MPSSGRRARRTKTGLAPEPPQAERQGLRRGRVEPLDVVDGDHDRSPLAQKLQHVAHRHGNRAAIDGVIWGLLSEQRDLERAPPRRRQRRQHAVEDVLEQVAEPHVSETALRLRRTRRNHAHPLRPCVLHACFPQRRLPDPRLALEHERSEPSVDLTDESVERGEFLLPADDLEHLLHRKRW